MNKEYGKKIGNALRAIQRLYAETSRLLQDCDKVIGKGRKPFPGGNVVTSDISKTLQAKFWMAECVYRWYQCKEKGVIEGITVAFLVKDGMLPDQPMLIAGQAKYRPKRGTTLEESWNPCDLWWAYLSAKDAQPGEVTTTEQLLGEFVDDEDNAKIERIKFVAVPLYSIRCVEDVVKRLDQVRKSRSR